MMYKNLLTDKSFILANLFGAMHISVVYILVFLSSYLIGSIPFSWIITKIKTGEDLRKIGSGNVGGRNVFRATKSRNWALFAGFLDVCRSVTAVALPFHLSNIWYFQNYPQYNLPLTDFFPDTALGFSLAFAGVAAIFGHNWSIYLLPGHAGRGITVVLGSMLYANPIIIAFWIILWPIVITIVGYSSITYIVVTLLVGVIALFLPSVMLMPWAQYNLALGVMLFIIALIMASRQRDNFRKIRAGEAKKMKIWGAVFGKKKMSDEILK